MGVFWLSFADPTRAKGAQLLGVAVVEGDSLGDAIQKAWALGCNPGGEVEGTLLPSDALSDAGAVLLARTPRDTLLSRAELKALGYEA